jgi:protein SCO1/2
MPAMTMPFQVEDPALLAGAVPGDLVTATLVVEEVRAYLTTLNVTGHADLNTNSDRPAISSVDILEPGDSVPGTPLFDTTGAAMSLPALRGHRVALTFIYTRCPLPDFCPLMDRHFAQVQAAIAMTPALADVQLVSVTVDPEFDTTEVLREHAESLGASPDIWRFVTTEPRFLREFAANFGVVAEPDPADATAVLHNLRTAIIGPDGRLVSVLGGNTWTPAELIAELESIPAAVN